MSWRPITPSKHCWYTPDPAKHQRNTCVGKPRPPSLLMASIPNLPQNLLLCWISSDKLEYIHTLASNPTIRISRLLLIFWIKLYTGLLREGRSKAKMPKYMDPRTMHATVMGLVQNRFPFWGGLHLDLPLTFWNSTCTATPGRLCQNLVS